MGIDESKAILSKSLTVIENTKSRLEEFDHLNFPTLSTQNARELLLDVLLALHDPKRFEPMDPSVLYNRVLELQNLVRMVESSSIDHVSWPLVGYCDTIWRSLFGEDGPKIFYSVIPEHNYSIFHFSQSVENLLDALLPRNSAKAVLNHRKIYCLQLASVEDDNLPLYANIGHEFGHAITRNSLEEIGRIFSDEFIKTSFFQQVQDDLAKIDKNQCERWVRRTMLAVFKIAEELFCDMVGASLMGPAFFLSLYEMSWGQDRHSFNIQLSPNDRPIFAYPSFQFRLHSIHQYAEIETFSGNIEEKFATLLADVETSHDSDTINLGPRSDPDSGAINKVLTDNLHAIKSLLESFLSASHTWFRRQYSKAISPISPKDVTDLLERLQCDILPNIVPDKDFDPLLGRPADLSSILNASALFRMELLASTITDHKMISKRTELVERLTAKALEVSFVQREYNTMKES